MEQAITITEDVITIAGHLFVHKDYSITNKELIIDALSVHYNLHTIKIVFFDGENIEFSGFDKFIKYICDCFGIPHDKVIFETHKSNVDGFTTVEMRPGIFLSIGQYLPEVVHDYQNKKSVGALLGRANPTRLRLAYEIDRRFPDNNYTVFQPQVEQIKHNYRFVKDLYQKELLWLETKQFDKDLISTHSSGMIRWQDSIASYNNVCNEYQIEIISETDVFSDFWFTEKTARCLAIGKPFVLISGKNSLVKLRNMGFKTFHGIIDELYDCTSTPLCRIDKALNSIEDIITSSDKDSLIDELYKIAAKNKEIYKQYVSK